MLTSDCLVVRNNLTLDCYMLVAKNQGVRLGKVWGESRGVSLEDHQVQKEIPAIREGTNTIDQIKVNTIHFRVRIETVNHPAIRSNCFIFLRVFKVFAGVVQS